MRIQKSRPASQSTKVRRREIDKTNLLSPLWQGTKQPLFFNLSSTPTIAPFIQFRCLSFLRVIPYSHRPERRKKEKGNHTQFPFRFIIHHLQPELLFQSPDRTYTHSLQFRLSSSSDNHCRESLTYRNDCRTNPSDHHPHILPLQLTHIKKLPSDKTPKSLHV